MQRTHLRIVVLAGCALGLGCGDPSSPLSHSPPTPRKFLAPLPPRSEVTVPAGPTSAGGGLGQTTTGVSVASGAVARIVARGALSFTLNPLCGPGTPPPPNFGTGPYGGGNHEGHVSVNLSGDTDFTDWLNYNSADSIWMAYRVNETPLSSRDLMVARQEFNGTCLTGGVTPTITYWYSIAGSHSLTIDVLGVDVAVSGDTIIQGQAVTATASLLNFAGNQISWSFDTAQFKPQIALPACANGVSCNYTPSRSGHFQACVIDEYGFYSICGVSNALSLLPPPDFSCTPNPVQRGSSVNCTVSGGGIAVTGWSFEGPSFDTATTLQISGPGVGSWSGTAVMSGVVRAAYSLNGVAQAIPLSLLLTVSSRPWSWNAADWNFSQGTAQACNPGPMVADTAVLVGWNRRKGSCGAGRVTPYPPENPDSGYTIAQIQSGPNSGIWYVTGVTYRMETESNLNSSLMSSSSLAFQLVDPADKQACKKLGSSVTSVNFFTFNDKCKNINVTTFLNALWAHEGFGLNNNNGHEAQGRIAAALPGNNVHALVERVYAGNEIDVRYFAGDQAFQASQRMSAVSSPHTYVRNNWCGSIWRYHRPMRKWLFSVMETDPGVCP